jgi:hypothetical protein
MRELLEEERKILLFIADNKTVLRAGSQDEVLISIDGQNKLYLSIYEESNFYCLEKDGFLYNTQGNLYVLSGLGNEALGILKSSEERLTCAVIDYIKWESETKIDDRYKQSLQDIENHPNKIKKILPELIKYLLKIV